MSNYDLKFEKEPRPYTQEHVVPQNKHANIYKYTQAGLSLEVSINISQIHYDSWLRSR